MGGSRPRIVDGYERGLVHFITHLVMKTKPRSRKALCGLVVDTFDADANGDPILHCRECVVREARAKELEGA